MSFVRPEAQAFLWKWREVLIGAASLAGGLWLVSEYYGVLFLFGCVAVVIGAMMVFVGYRRTRFPQLDGGAGVVEVDERLITYFGPEGGASVSLDELWQIEIATTAEGPWQEDLFWYISDTNGTVLVIPGGAENAEALFEALSPLKGFDWDGMARANRSTEDAKFVIWRRPKAELH